MDEDWDWDRDEVVDLDVTGDPQLDVYGYQSPRRTFHPARPANVDWLAQSKRDRAEREQRRRAVQRQRSQEAPAQRRDSASHEGRGWSEPAQPAPVAVTTQPVPGPQPGQHGAYFERRTVRRWWAPWTKRTTWQQLSAWQMSPPPAGAPVVTVPSVAALDGRVRTIGTAGPNGTVVY